MSIPKNPTSNPSSSSRVSSPSSEQVSWTTVEPGGRVDLSTCEIINFTDEDIQVSVGRSSDGKTVAQVYNQPFILVQVVNDREYYVSVKLENNAFFLSASEDDPQGDSLEVREEKKGFYSSLEKLSLADKKA